MESNPIDNAQQRGSISELPRCAPFHHYASGNSFHHRAALPTVEGLRPFTRWGVDPLPKHLQPQEEDAYIIPLCERAWTASREQAILKELSKRFRFPDEGALVKWLVKMLRFMRENNVRGLPQRQASVLIISDSITRKSQFLTKPSRFQPGQTVPNPLKVSKGKVSPLTTYD